MSLCLRPCSCDPSKTLIAQRAIVESHPYLHKARLGWATHLSKATDPPNGKSRKL